MLSGLGQKPREIVQKENTTQRLQNEINELEEQKLRMETESKAEQRSLVDQMKKL